MYALRTYFFILPWRFVWLQIYFVVPRVEICFAVTFCFAVALVGHRRDELIYCFANAILDEEEFVLLYDAYKSTHSIYPYLQAPFEIQ